MPYKLNKIIFQKDNLQDYETHTRQLNIEIDNPFIAGKLREMFPEENQSCNILELSTSLLYNESGLTKLIPEVGPKVIYYLELKPEHKLKQLVVEPEDVVVDIYFGREDTLIYSFYNPTRRKSIAITASIEKDDQNVYSKLKSDPKDIYWRQHFVRLAMNKINVEKTKTELPTNMTVDEVAEYLQVKKKTIRNWTSEGKIPYVKLGSAVRYRKVQIDNWIVAKEKKSKRKRATH
jgi:excisionase family DNA binding protein